jgi:steroid 5-alpha reductase family enzyme
VRKRRERGEEGGSASEREEEDVDTSPPPSSISVIISCIVVLGLIAGLAVAGSVNGVRIGGKEVGGEGEGEGEKEGGYPMFALALTLATAFQILAAIPAIIWQTEKYYDLVGSITYFSITLLNYFLTITVGLGTDFDPNKVTPAVGIPIAICTWSGRLGRMLFLRVLSSGKDKRFDAMKKRPLEFLRVWLLQALWISFTAAAGWCAITTVRPDAEEHAAIGGGKKVEVACVVVGLIVWLAGFTLEVRADSEKAAFRRNPANKGRFITTGLWSLSRHPNYCGEIILWFGIALCSLPYLAGPQFITLISPVFVFILIRYISGVPLLEEAGERKWGEEEEWRNYVERVPVLFPTSSLIGM